MPPPKSEILLIRPPKASPGGHVYSHTILPDAAQLQCVRIGVISQSAYRIELWALHSDHT